jgi:hypothetical protein
LRFGVAHDVGQRFLSNSIADRVDRRIQAGGQWIGKELDAQTRPSFNNQVLRRALSFKNSALAARQSACFLKNVGVS